MISVLAETPDSVPYPWVVAIVGCLCAVIGFLVKLILDLYKREQARADAAWSIINSFIVVPPTHKEP